MTSNRLMPHVKQLSYRAALQETRLADNGSLTEKHYIFFWQEKKLEDRRELGEGFAVRNSLLSMIEPPTGGSERILTL